MSKEEIILVAVIVAIILSSMIYIVWLRRHMSKGGQIEVKREDIEELAKYIKLKKQKDEEEQILKNLAKADVKQKLEIYKQTKEVLLEKLKTQLDEKEWKSLDSIMSSADKGGVGIYVIYNEAKNKYYVGQAKQIYKRIRDHFEISDMVLDRLAGDRFQVKFLTTNELDGDYRLDHIEKTGIEIYNSDRTGYNKTTGNV